MQLLRLKAVLFTIIPFAIYLLIAERASWRPRVLPHDSSVYAIAFSADSRHITTAQVNGNVLDWEVKSKRVTRALRLPHYAKGLETWQVISPDGSLVAVCTGDCAVRLWNIQTGRLLHAFVQSRTEKYTPGVAFSPDSKTIATTSWRTPVKR